MNENDSQQAELVALGEEQFWRDKFNKFDTYDMPIEIFRKLQDEKDERIKREGEEIRRQLNNLN